MCLCDWGFFFICFRCFSLIVCATHMPTQSPNICRWWWWSEFVPQMKIADYLSKYCAIWLFAWPKIPSPKLRMSSVYTTHSTWFIIKQSFKIDIMPNELATSYPFSFHLIFVLIYICIYLAYNLRTSAGYLFSYLVINIEGNDDVVVCQQIACHSIQSIASVRRNVLYITYLLLYLYWQSLNWFTCLSFTRFFLLRLWPQEN